MHDVKGLSRGLRTHSLCFFMQCIHITRLAGKKQLHSQSRSKSAIGSPREISFQASKVNSKFPNGVMF